MALKIISGFIRMDASARHQGQATLNLTSATFGANDPVTPFDVRVIGSGPFLSKPCVMLALRRVRVAVGDINPPDRVDLNLGDSLLPLGAVPNRLRISWKCTHTFGSTDGLIQGDAVREISFLVIGHTKDPITINPPILRRKRVGRQRRKA